MISELWQEWQVRRERKWLMTSLHKNGLLTHIDRRAIEGYLDAYRRFLRAQTKRRPR